MTPTSELVALMPVRRPDPAEPAPRLADRLRGAIGRRRLVFPCLAADPTRLYGVLLSSSSDPGAVRVNGQPVEPLWRGPGRVLLDPSPFRAFENVVSVQAGATDAVLAPVIRRGEAANLIGLAPGTHWRIQSLAGHDMGSAAGPPRTRPRASDRPSAPTAPTVRDLAGGLTAMIAPNGDVWSFYDIKAASPRLPGWRWDTGIVLEALVAAAEALSDRSLLESATHVAERLLATRTYHLDCPGGFAEWADPRYLDPDGEISSWVAPFNAAFVAAGLIRLHRATGREKYLQAARQGLRVACGRGMTPAGGLYGYFLTGPGRWRYLGQINDSGILGRGLSLIPDQQWAVRGARLSSEFILSKAGHADGHIGRAWWDPRDAARPGDPLFPEWKRHPDRVVPKVFLRGQAWVLLGLAGAARLGAGGITTEASRHLASFIVKSQLADGSWFYSGMQPELGVCAKTTAALALALIEWSEVSGDPSVLPAAASALDFLAGCRRPGIVPRELAGMPVDESAEGCIVYYRNRPVICAYAGALELLARLALERIA